MNFICTKCGKKESTKTLKPHCDCGGLWKLEYELPKFDLKKIKKDNWSIFRYREFMALESKYGEEISLGEGMSPVIRFDENLLIKMDYFMPTLSYKDRGAAALMTHCKSLDVENVVQDSSGNAGNSVAAYAAKAKIKCEIFVPEGTSPNKIRMIKAHGAKATVVEGNRDHCAEVCRKKVQNEGVYYANHVYNPFFYEGTKTYIYEVYEQLGRIPENIFVPVGNGTLYLGVIFGLEHLLKSGIIDKMPQIFAVQSENCDPLLQAQRENLNEPKEVTVKPTLAEGIAIGKPMRGEEILELAKKYSVKFIHAPEDKIMEAKDILAKSGIYCEHTTASIYAAYLNYVKNNGPLKDSIIPMTGAGLKSDH